MSTITKLTKVNKKAAALFTLFMSLSASAFADFTVVTDLKSDAEAAVVSYMKDDPSCNSCRGNARSAGVEYLLRIRDDVSQDEFLRGKVWANTCQDRGSGNYLYGSLDASPGQCGYTEVKFLLPVVENAGVWSANFSHITTDINDDTQVQKVVPATLFPTNFIQTFGVLAVRADPHYPTLQIDIEQIFLRCVQWL
jgi:hypothetical protein